MMLKIEKTIVKRYSFLLFIMLAFTLACDATDKTKSVYTTPEKSADKITNSQPIQVKQAIQSWSNEDLWESFSKTKSAASFSLNINEQLPVYDFKIVGKLKSNNLLPMYVEVKSNGRIIQKLKALDKFDNEREGWDVEWDFEHANIVEVVDINFDGYLDLRLLYNTGATGNNWYGTYLFNPSKGKFIYHKELSQLSGISIDHMSKQIITYNRGGFCDEYREYYKFLNNNLILVKAEWTEIDRRRDMEVGGFGCFKYTGIPHNGSVKLHFDEREISYIRKRMKEIKEEPLNGSLDRRQRGPLGMPMD
jgi:hypothetical protein